MTTRLAHSNIGYRGLGADDRPITEYYAWNPGGFGCSRGCPDCWARSLAKRFTKCPECAAFTPHLHPERLGQPAATKKPGVVLVNFTCDTLDPSRSDEDIGRIAEAAVRAPWHHYVWLTQVPARLPVLWTALPALEDNHTFGLTVRRPERLFPAWVGQALGLFAPLGPHRAWLSIEPLEESLANLPTALAGVVLGQGNRRGMAGTETLDHVRGVVRQARRADLRVYVKQLWIDGGLETDPARFPEDLRLRDLPWSAP